MIIPGAKNVTDKYLLYPPILILPDRDDQHSTNTYLEDMFTGAPGIGSAITDTNWASC